MIIYVCKHKFIGDYSEGIEKFIEAKSLLVKRRHTNIHFLYFMVKRLYIEKKKGNLRRHSRSKIKKKKKDVKNKRDN